MGINWNRLGRKVLPFATVGLMALHSVTEAYSGIRFPSGYQVAKRRMHYASTSLKDYFNRACSDGFLSKEEQVRIVSDYKDIEDLVWKFSPYLRVDRSDKKIYEGIVSNFCRFDQGRPDVEEILENEGLNVKVEGKLSKQEISSGIFGLFAAAYGLFLRYKRRN